MRSLSRRDVAVRRGRRVSYSGCQLSPSVERDETPSSVPATRPCFFRSGLDGLVRPQEGLVIFYPGLAQSPSWVIGLVVQ